MSNEMSLLQNILESVYIQCIIRLIIKSDPLAFQLFMDEDFFRSYTKAVRMT